MKRSLLINLKYFFTNWNFVYKCLVDYFLNIESQLYYITDACASKANHWLTKYCRFWIHMASDWFERPWSLDRSLGNASKKRAQCCLDPHQNCVWVHSSALCILLIQGVRNNVLERFLNGALLESNTRHKLRSMWTTLGEAVQADSLNRLPIYQRSPYFEQILH